MIERYLQNARAAERSVRSASPEDRERALQAMADALADAESAVLDANGEDQAEFGPALSPALRDRLSLSPARCRAMVDAIRAVAAQPDPLGARRLVSSRSDGLRVMRQRTPLGVIAIVFEARPNVSAECGALAVRTGNAIVLRGGREALRSNRAIVGALRSGLAQIGQAADQIQLIDRADRADVTALLTATGQVDLLVPRGGKALMDTVDAHARVPVVRHGQGICHMYVHEDADPAMATRLALDAKIDRPGVCNALETLLLHPAALRPVLAELAPRLAAAKVVLHADPAVREACTALGVPTEAATEADYDTEYLSLQLAVRAIDGLDAALAHIDRHGTHHTAAIVTESQAVADAFFANVDASCVLWNASTRFNDGGALGLGAELGISTSKMHAFGPMGAEALTSEKFVVVGEGHVRDSSGWQAAGQPAAKP